MPDVDVKKKTAPDAAAVAVKPAVEPAKDDLKDALKDPLANKPQTEKPKSQQTGDQKRDKEAPASANLIPGEKPGEALIVVKQGEESAVVALPKGGKAQVVAQTSEEGVKPDKIDAAIKKVAEPARPSSPARKPPEDKAVTKKVDV